MIVMDVPVSYKASTCMLLTLTLYRITLSEVVSSTVISLIHLSSQSDSLLLRLRLTGTCSTYSTK